MDNKTFRSYEEMFYNGLNFRDAEDTTHNGVATFEMNLEHEDEFYFLRATVRVVADDVTEIDVHELLSIDDLGVYQNITSNKDTVNDVIDKYFYDIASEAFEVLENL